MPRRLRRSARARTVTVLLAVLVLGGTADWGHAGGDDPGCDSFLAQHDHAAHHFASHPPAHETPASHCDLCHLLRLLHTALSAKPLVASLASRVSARRPMDGVVTVTLFAFSLPSRAPPALAL